jgi:hypothetical protein
MNKKELHLLSGLAPLSLSRAVYMTVIVRSSPDRFFGKFGADVSPGTEILSSDGLLSLDCSVSYPIIIWEAVNLLLLIRVVIGLVMQVRWVHGRGVFTERDWLFLFGRPREKVLTARLWFRFAVLWVAVILAGLGIAFYVLPYGLVSFLVAVVLAVGGILLIAPKWLG